jgi:hypothetical protein
MYIQYIYGETLLNMEYKLWLNPREYSSSSTSIDPIPGEGKGRIRPESRKTWSGDPARILKLRR